MNPELDRMAPSFDIQGSQIQVIKTPAEFYETLKGRILHAKRRIFLSTLYIGKSERELIETLRDALRRNPALKLSILTDALRGTREAPNPSSASLLVPLVEEFGADRVEIRMYHTPNLTGLRKKYVPKRINEGWGLQHMKLYGVDDEIILSGANLSSDYFTNRQDRYHLFTSKEVTDHFAKIHDGVSSFSFLVKPSQEPSGFTLAWPSTNSAPSPLEKPNAFVKSTTSTLQPLLAPPPNRTPPGELADTRVYMLGQMSQVMKPDTSTELPIVTRVLEMLASPGFKGSSWTFTAGYFNPAPSLTKLLLNTASTNNTVITAAPEANGFYKSKGVSGLLPDAYILLARRFLHSVTRAGRDSDIALKEWRFGTVGQPGGWTYHAKGLWVTMPGEANPAVSVIGSSNYTRRSYSLDLEVGAMIVTRDDGLKAKLGDEQRWLQEHAKTVTRDDFAKNDRRVGLKHLLSNGQPQVRHAIDKDPADKVALVALNHLLEHAPLDDDLAHAEQVLDVDVLQVQRGALPRQLVHGVEQDVPPVAGDEEGAAVVVAEAHGRQDALDVALAQAALEQLGRQVDKVLGQGHLHAVLADDQLAAAVAVAQGGAPGLVVDLAVEAGAEVAGLGSEDLAAAAQHGALAGAETGAAGALLGTDLAVRAVDLVAGLGGGSALAGVVALVGDGEVEEVAAEGEVEVLDGPLLEGGGLEGGEVVDGDGDGRDCEMVSD
ncbi:CDP-diacylglycerol--glycerol-3-phosphate 3-phosphatidyltransferase [Paramyrothecium foliicola]|nr:CDP-diacylglycerol--glycerol-3-phosphate 3-phosphatidyltransferase [Paramyrothecium foliicola]